MQLHEMQTRSLKEKILDKLAEKHPELKAEQAPKVTEAEIKKFYEGNSGIKELGSKISRVAAASNSARCDHASGLARVSGTASRPEPLKKTAVICLARVFTVAAATAASRTFLFLPFKIGTNTP